MDEAVAAQSDDPEQIPGYDPMSKEDRSPKSSHARPNLWACLAPADNDQRRNEIRRYTTKYDVNSERQLTGKIRA